MNSFNSSSHLSTASLNMSHNSHNSQSHSSTNRFLPSGTGTDSGTYSGSGTRLSYSQRGTNASANNPNNNNNNGDADASQHSNGTGTSHTAQKDTNASSSNRVWRCFGYTVHCNSYNKFRQWCALYCFPICQKILSSLLWRILLVLGNFILLFGSPIHMLWLPKLCDPVMDVLYTLVLLVFMVDMIFRAAVLPGYFGLGVSQIYYARHHHWSYSSIMRWIKMGSFLFCCDLLSTLTLLFDISYIHQERYSITTMEIQLDRVGIPDKAGINSVNNASPWENDWGLMITILKTARIVRFVRASAVATIIGKVNWYWPQQKVSAVANHYLQCCSTGIDNNAAAAAANSQEENNNNNNNGDNSEHPTNTTNANTTTNATNAKVNVNANAYAASNNRYTTMAAATTRRKDFSDSSPANHYQANANWGGLGTATLAAVKAKGQAIERQEQKKRKQSKGGNIMAAFLQKVLQTLGLMPIKDTVGQKHLAASKIQRAWRRAVAKHAAGIDHLEHFQEEVGGNGGMIRNNNNNAGGTISTAAAAAAGKTNSWNHSASYNKKEQATTSKKKMFHKLPGTSKGSVNANGLPITTATSNPNKTGKPIYTADGVAESQVGGAMRELTGQRVAIGMICALLLTAMFTYVENDASRPATMVILHRQTTGTKATKDGTATILVPPPEEHVQMALKAARQSSVPDMYRFELHTDQKTISEDLNRLNTNNEADLRDCEKLKIIIKSTNYSSPTKELVRSIGYFDYKQERRNQAYVQLFSTIFILLLWLFGVTAFAGPVMVLVVLPIERMVRLLGMLMMDPLGYQSTSRYRRFVAEEDQLTKNTRWTKEVLKGMETSFLMSTILRIGSLMKVGFGSAGVEIIRKNLEKKQGGKVNLLTTKGLTVSCIFLFCDIRQFTDATECLQEEVFVFTNRIAAVVHSFCHSYGGSANKNVGDAFLCSWLLDDPPNDGGFGGGDALYAKNNQADKCLLCVVKILMSLHHNSYYIETMSEAARQRLLAKLKKRPGPVVQMGCGLHAGKAVQGAIGSERKIDATYVSEAVERAEFLESSTKKYGLQLLMSDSFHSLLHANNRQRCRLIDMIAMPDEDEDEDDPAAILYERDDLLHLYTYDIDIDALWTAPPSEKGPSRGVESRTGLEAGSMSDADSQQTPNRRGDFNRAGLSQRTMPAGSSSIRRGRRLSILAGMTSKHHVTSNNASSSKVPDLDEFHADHSSSAATNLKASGTASHGPNLGTSDTIPEHGRQDQEFRKPELVLPTGPSLYNPTIWRSEAMFRIRKKFLDGLFFHNYSQGLQSFYARDWDRAKQMFSLCESDGPSKYFLNQIEKNGGKPPPNFRPYGTP